MLCINALWSSLDVPYFGAGIDAFVLPHKLVSTGISGVGLIFILCNGIIPWGSWNMIFKYS